MNVIRWNPMEGMTLLQNQFNRLFEAALHTTSPTADDTHTWAPATDIRETDEELVVAIDLPGVDSKNIDVRVEDNILTISGQRTWDHKMEKETFHRAERLYGNFVRSFTLGTAVDADKIRANYNDGVLTISLPKAETAKPRRIEIAAPAETVTV